MLHVGRQGTPTVKAFNHLDMGVAQSGYSSLYVLEMRRELSSVGTEVAGGSYFLFYLTSVSDVEVSVVQEGHTHCDKLPY